MTIHFLKYLWQKKTIVKKSMFLRWSTPFTLLLCLYATTIYAFSWQDLWINSDHTAQKMMKKGQYTEAQKHFKREDWRATAAFRAGNYQEASALFSALNQADGYYNAGNAYAHQGEYEKALHAYDKALALNKQDQDAIDNRQIVAELLKKQRAQKQDTHNQNKKDQDEQDQNKQKKDKQEQSSQDQNKSSQDKQNPDKQAQEKQDQDKQNQNKQNLDKQNQDKQDQDKQDPNKQDQAAQNQTGSSEQSKQAMEKQTLNQWLNMIPDDPGGLLREKFLRDYLRRRGES